MNRFTFTVAGRCVPAPRMTYRGKRSPKVLRYMSYRHDVAWAAKAAKVPRFDGPVAVKMDIYLLKYGKEGDIDNMQKIILDALNGIAWSDDRQVAEIHARKHYVTTPQKEQVQVTVTKYTPEKEVATG
ncbi:RusA family crossover junction endodeoxyribonuclease [Polycladomyces sp. WAk]|uniref:RusA family crossover junction endodeoxyribonuclease n=1 Tax=Polycladomyces zharkentensis TaxID=2807616 RepID=A0ABS2WMM9_9BACL|nr:RusA family crossover junction endodeoxyribonuclease [Polycladomyces sp. WAk]MBN2910790.1 RusA family crossover junction endodeoxyribonuclease [Polycladomyces sp. WAk]